jgi:6-phosphogluconolactonase
MLHTFSTADELYAHAAEAVVAAGNAALAQRGRFVIALAGGSTPRGLYRCLSAPPLAARLDWSRAEIFFGDERTVGPDDPDSNYRMAREALLDPLGLSPAKVHRMLGERDPLTAATEYEQQVAACFDIATTDEPPEFDLILLGMGDDGHTASLFPHTQALAERSRWVVANEVPQHATTRITMTYPLINNARQVMFLVAGASKAQALASVLRGPPNLAEFPSQGISPSGGQLDWFLDSAAASQLS